MADFVSRAGQKLQFALSSFNLSVSGLVCADFGSSTGGFVDCLLQNGASKVYTVDTCYGELAWKLRNNPRVVVLERTNALHVRLPEKAGFISVDVGWTKQSLVLPNVVNNLKKGGVIVSLIKPHYEAGKAKLSHDEVESVVSIVRGEIEGLGLAVKGLVESPLLGSKGNNREFLAFLSGN